MARSNPNLTSIFTDVANSIRAKKGTSEDIYPVDFADEIATITGGQEYAGPYTITENIVLPVAGLTMTQDLVINVSGGGGASYALVDNEYGKTIVFMAGYVPVQNDYGTTLII